MPDDSNSGSLLLGGLTFASGVAASVVESVAKHGFAEGKRSVSSGSVLRRPQETALLAVASGIEYQSLRTSSEIRLAKIEAGYGSSVIKCSLRHVDLVQKPKFTALSYTWKEDPTLIRGAYTVGKAALKDWLAGADVKAKIPDSTGALERTRVIMCNGRPTKIYPNLYNALAALRKRQPGEYWIDAICINQEDSTEKTSQVQLMGQIYKQASTVTIWLGTISATHANSLLDLARLAAKESNETSSGVLARASDRNQMRSQVLGASIAVVMSQWFKRVWVIQELCCARHVSYLMDGVELKKESLLLAFQSIHEMATEMGAVGSHDQEMHLYHTFGRIIVPQISHFPSTLQLREAFNTGRLWTLSEWLLACRGRAASEAKDFIFAGLSLVDPDSLSIDGGLTVAGSSPGPGEEADLTARPSELIDHWNLLPHGLWGKLEADYSEDVSMSEVLVNTAACLLSHSGTSEILSLAARPSMPETYASQWMFSTSDVFGASGLPSWVPVPGTWTSNLTEPLAFQQTSTITATDHTASGQKACSISSDGRRLSIQARAVGTVKRITLEVDSISLISTPALEYLVRYMLRGAEAEEHGDTSVLDDLVQTLLRGQETGSQEALCLARSWLCTLIGVLVMREFCLLEWKHLYDQEDTEKVLGMTEVQFQDWRDSRDTEARRDANRLVSNLKVAQQRYADCRWPIGESGDTAHWRSRTAQLFREFVSADEKRKADQRRAIDQKPQTDDTRRDDDSIRATAESTKAEDAAVRSRAAHASIHEIKKWFSELRESDITPPDIRLDQALNSTLAWWKLFETADGDMGLGPRWIAVGDQVELVQGALVPYIFTSWESERFERRQVISVELERIQAKLEEARSKLEDQDREWKLKEGQQLDPLSRKTRGYRVGKVKRYRDEERETQRKLKLLEAEEYTSNTLVLKGEAYFSKNRSLERNLSSKQLRRINVI